MSINGYDNGLYVLLLLSFKELLWQHEWQFDDLSGTQGTTVHGANHNQKPVIRLMWSVVMCCQKAWHTSMVFGDKQRTAGCPCASSLYRCCLRERLTGWLLWQLDSCSYRRSHRSMPWRWGREGGWVCLFYLYEVPRTCKAVSFTSGAWAWVRKDSTKQDMEREHIWSNIRHQRSSLKKKKLQ